jgi:WD40 repeat protein
MAVTPSCRSVSPCLVIAVFALGLSSGLLPNHTSAETAPPGRRKAPADVLGVAFSPDGKTRLSGGGDKTTWLWDVATRQPTRTLEGHTAGVASVAFTLAGRTLITGGWDNAVRTWQVCNGKPSRNLMGHRGPFRCVAIRPVGRTLVSASSDATALPWDLP